MDARELTKVFNDMSNEILETKKQLDYVTQELEKQRMILEDLKSDMKQLGG